MPAPKKIASTCPMCSAGLAISRLSCTRCDTVIESVLPIPPLVRLPAELQQFALVFLKCRGNIREVERELGISYPTVCKRLDLLNALLGQNEAPEPPPAPPTSADQILQRLERGDVTAKEAANLLKKVKEGK